MDGVDITSSVYDNGNINISNVVFDTAIAAYLLEYNGCLNIMKGAIECSNIVSTVSPSYAEEIKTPEYAHGLEGEILRAAGEGKLCGILNGIDYVENDPSKDNLIEAKYAELPAPDEDED